MLHKYLTMIRQDVKDAMSRRCGLDELNIFILLCGFIFVVIALFSQKLVFVLLGAAFIVLCYLRIFSKQLDKRKKENDFYMKYMGSAVAVMQRIKLRLKMRIKTMQDKEYAYFVCNTCGQIVRVPKGKNKVNIRCPKCNMTFIKRT